jgi:hypothetical protein
MVHFALFGNLSHDDVTIAYGVQEIPSPKFGLYITLSGV